MPLYDYKCPEHGYFTKKQPMAMHAEAECPHCGQVSPQVLLSAPSLDIEGMSRAGCPGAFETVGDRIEKRHRDVPQAHRPAGRY